MNNKFLVLNYEFYSVFFASIMHYEYFFSLYLNSDLVASNCWMPPSALNLDNMIQICQMGKHNHQPKIKELTLVNEVCCLSINKSRSTQLPST
jgi:hypothetical protein